MPSLRVLAQFILISLVCINSHRILSMQGVHHRCWDIGIHRRVPIFVLALSIQRPCHYSIKYQSCFCQAGKLQMTNDSGYSLKALYTLIWFLPSRDHLTESRMMSTDSPIVLLIVLRNLVVVVFDLPIPLSVRCLFSLCCYIYHFVSLRPFVDHHTT